MSGLDAAGTACMFRHRGMIGHLHDHHAEDMHAQNVASRGLDSCFDFFCSRAFSSPRRFIRPWRSSRRRRSAMRCAPRADPISWPIARAYNRAPKMRWRVSFVTTRNCRPPAKPPSTRGSRRRQPRRPLRHRLSPPRRRRPRPQWHPRPPRRSQSLLRSRNRRRLRRALHINRVPHSRARCAPRAGRISCRTAPACGPEALPRCNACSAMPHAFPQPVAPRSRQAAKARQRQKQRRRARPRQPPQRRRRRRRRRRSRQSARCR